MNLALEATWPSIVVGFGIDLAVKSTAILMIVLLLQAIVGRRRAYLGAAVGNAGLIALLLLPVSALIFPPVAIPWRLTESAPAQPPSVVSFPPTASHDAAPSSPRPVEAPITSAARPVPASMQIESRPLAALPRLGSLDWAALAMALYLLGAMVLATRLCRSVLAIARLRRSCERVHDVEWTNALESWRSHLEIGRKVGLYRSPEVHVPLALGWLKPAVVLPESLAADTFRGHRDSVLIHELAHVRRGDYPWNLCLRLTQILYWPHLLVWVLGRVIVSLRERACDDLCISKLGGPLAYRESLIAVAAEMTRRPHLALGLAMASTSKLGRRLAQINRSKGDDRCLPGRLARVAIAALSLAVGGVMGTIHLKSSEAKTEMLQPPPAETTISEKEIAGRVVDVEGNPIEGALVQAYSWVPFYKTQTDRDGRFRLLVFNRPGMEPREGAEMRIGKEGYSPVMFESVKGGTSDLAVTLTNTTYFEGTLTGMDGRPVANALIRACHPHREKQREIGKYWYETHTDAAGHYRLYANPETFEFQVRIPGSGVARLASERIERNEAKPLDMTLNRGVTFRAKVIDSQTNQPVAGVRLWHWQHPDVEGISDSQGVVSIEDMFPGRFEFNLADETATIQLKDASYARWWSDQCLSEWNRRMLGTGNPRTGKWQRNLDSLDFDLSVGMEPVTIVVEKAVTIRGRVLDPDGKPVAGATVAPALTGSGNSLTGDTRYSVETDADGAYRMVLPASGERDYNLVAHDGKLAEWRTWANGVIQPFETKPGDVLEKIDIQLTRPGIVRGRVVNPDGSFPADREVHASPTDVLENRYYLPTARTDAEGRFELKFLRPGEQSIQVEPFWLYAREAPAGTSQNVTIKAGEVVEGVELFAQPRR